MKKFASHISHYISLFGILAAGTLAFFLFPWDKTFQASAALATAVAYVVWGIVHHVYHEDLYLAVLVEYVIVASLGLVLVFSVLLRA